MAELKRKIAAKQAERGPSTEQPQQIASLDITGAHPLQRTTSAPAGTEPSIHHASTQHHLMPPPKPKPNSLQRDDSPTSLPDNNNVSRRANSKEPEQRKEPGVASGGGGSKGSRGPNSPTAPAPPPGQGTAQNNNRAKRQKLEHGKGGAAAASIAANQQRKSPGAMIKHPPPHAAAAATVPIIDLTRAVQGLQEAEDPLSPLPQPEGFSEKNRNRMDAPGKGLDDVNRQIALAQAASKVLRRNPAEELIHVQVREKKEKHAGEKRYVCIA